MLALPLAALAGGAAYAVAARRDYGAGLVTARPGRPRPAACSVGRSGWPGGLSGARWPGWAAGFAFGAAAAGAAAKGIGVVLFGAVPRATVAGGWTVVSAVVLVAFFGPLLRFPEWIMDISPFTHVPKLPGGPMHAAPRLWLTQPGQHSAAGGSGGSSPGSAPFGINMSGRR